MAWPDLEDNVHITIGDFCVHVHVHGEGDAETFRQSVLKLLGTIKSNTEKLMSSLDDDLALIQSQGTQIAGVNTLITTLNQRVADALSGVTLPPAVQAKVDAVFTGLTDNSAALATALATDAGGNPLPPPQPAP